MKKPSIKKPNIKNILPKWSSKNIRKGSYSLGISVVVLAIAVVFNLVARQSFPPSATPQKSW